LRERFDAGTGLVALGAVLLLVSLFVDWYDPSGDAWNVFEIVDAVLALAAVACLVAVVPRYAGLQRAVPFVCFVALFIVAVQVIDPPPVAAGDELATGAWLALAATLLMAAGAALSAASISVTVDVRSRDRRRRTSAIDARESQREEEAAAADAADEADPEAAGLWRARRPPYDDRAPAENGPARHRPAPDDEPQPVEAPAGDDAPGPAPHAGDPPAGFDPDRTQALDPVDPPPREDGP
jgi:hypothetical protein